MLKQRMQQIMQLMPIHTAPPIRAVLSHVMMPKTSTEIPPIAADRRKTFFKSPWRFHWHMISRQLLVLSARLGLAGKEGAAFSSVEADRMGPH